MRIRGIINVLRISVCKGDADRQRSWKRSPHMATNMAAKRAKKAQRRKQVVAQKRQLAATESGLASRASRAATMPIQHCLLTESIFECGMGTLILARGLTPRQVTLSMFLLDT